MSSPKRDSKQRNWARHIRPNVAMTTPSHSSAIGGVQFKVKPRGRRVRENRTFAKINRSGLAGACFMILGQAILAILETPSPADARASKPTLTKKHETHPFCCDPCRCSVADPIRSSEHWRLLGKAIIARSAQCGSCERVSSGIDSAELFLLE